MIGTTLSHFKITAKLGEGGMGEVYCAEDTKLRREVAIKVLPEAFTEDPERFARFEREAHVLASLNHPNIAAIHDLAEDQGTHFLVLELAEGEDLAARLSRGPVPVEDALPLALQIAEALEAAHEKGIVHRDLKPANVMVGPAGKVKVLDFGLAKAWGVEPESLDSLSMSPTLTAQLTEAGTILGTAAYMSPEQAQGRAVDRRGDIWAFGCVFYEMLVGSPAFRGVSFSDTLAAVLRSEPDLSQLPLRTPQSAVRLVRRCLTKDPRTRLQAIGEARITLEQDQADPARDLSTSIDRPAPVRPWLPWALLGIMTFAALVAAGLYWSARSELQLSPPSGMGGPVRFELTVPYLTWSADENGVALSPEGGTIAYIAPSAPGEPPMLWVRDLENPDPHVVPGTEGAVNPFWSPDGRGIGYFQQDAIRVVDRAGGPSRIVFKVEQTFGPPTLSRDGTLLLASVPFGADRILSISIEGGEPVPVTPPVGEGELGHVFPHWLPDGRRFLYLALSANAEHPSQLYLGSVDGGDPRPLRGVHSRAEYASGELFYWEDGTIVARPFDADRAAFTGDPAPVCQTTGGHLARTGMAVFAVAQHGNAVACGRRDQSVDLRWFDRSGRDQGPLGKPGVFGNPRISPSGDRVAAERENPRTGSDDVWIFDLERGVPTRLVGGPGDDDSPAWSPDGERLAYTSDATGPPRIFIRQADGTGGPTEVRTDEGLPSYVIDWSTDGTSVLYRAYANDPNLYLAFVDGAKPSRLFAGGPGDQVDARFSADGRWVALASSELGSMEVFVAPLADGTALQRVSPAGGRAPAWSRDGREIYYGQGATLYAVSFSSRTGTIGLPRELFSLGPHLRIDDFDVAREGDRFLIAVEDLDRSRSSITLVLNRSVPDQR